MIADARTFERPVELRAGAHRAAGGRRRSTTARGRTSSSTRAPATVRASAASRRIRRSASRYARATRSTSSSSSPTRSRGRRSPTSRAPKRSSCATSRERHPEARKPVVIGNCQGGWAAMMLAARAARTRRADRHQRRADVVLGRATTATTRCATRAACSAARGSRSLASDLGDGKFDGAYLVENFENLNPRTRSGTSTTTCSPTIDTEPPRFLEFERWWGGFYLMNREEIEWIVEQPVRRQQARGGRGATGPRARLRPAGDQVADHPVRVDGRQHHAAAAGVQLGRRTSTRVTEEIKANGQVIVGLMHERRRPSRHLRVGQGREEGAYADRRRCSKYIEPLPPGLYGMQIEEHGDDGSVRYDVMLTERRVEDLQVLQKYDRKDEKPFEAVERTSETLASAYETFVHPVLAPMVTPAAAGAARTCNPQRVQRWAVSDLNPFLWPIKGVADMVRANRAPRDNDGLTAGNGAVDCRAHLRVMEPLSRPARCVLSKTVSSAPMARAGIGMAAAGQEAVETEPGDVRNAPLVKEALSHIEDGDPTKAMVRAALLLMKAGTGRRRLSAMKRVRELGRQGHWSSRHADGGRPRNHPRAVLHRRLRTGEGAHGASQAPTQIRRSAQNARSARPSGGPDRGERETSRPCWAKSGASSRMARPEASRRSS